MAARRRKKKEVEPLEAIPEDQLAPVPDDLMEQVRKMQRAVQAAPDLDGAVSRVELQEQASPRDTASGISHEQMKALAGAMVLDTIEAHEKDTQYSIGKTLASLGIPSEMYLQISQDPEWTEIVKRTTDELVATPRYIGMMLAMTSKAQSGDVQALKALNGMRQDLETETEQMLRRYQQEGGRELFMIELEERIREMSNLKASYQQVDIPEDVIADQRKRIHTVVGEQKRYDVDHKDMFTGTEEE